MGPTDRVLDAGDVLIIDNEDIGIDISGPINADGSLGLGNAGWRAQATNFFVDSGVDWSVRAFVICATVQ